MNLKKIFSAMLFLPMLSLAGCNDNITIDQALVEKIWEEVKTITQIDPDTTFNIRFLDWSPDGTQDTFGRYLGDGTIEIYLQANLKRVWQHRYYYWHSNDYSSTGNKFPSIYFYNINEKEAEAILYNTIAHELLHYALHVKGEATDQHKIMRDRGYLKQAANFISDYFQLSRDGIQQVKSLECLNRSVERDELEKKTRKVVFLPSNQ